jgi:hypothetical protein
MDHGIDTIDRSFQRRRDEHIALDGLDIDGGEESGAVWAPYQDTGNDAGLAKLADDLHADEAGCSGHEDSSHALPAYTAARPVMSTWEMATSTPVGDRARDEERLGVRTEASDSPEVRGLTGTP